MDVQQTNPPLHESGVVALAQSAARKTQLLSLKSIDVLEALETAPKDQQIVIPWSDKRNLMGSATERGWEPPPPLVRLRRLKVVVGFSLPSDDGSHATDELKLRDYLAGRRLLNVVAVPHAGRDYFPRWLRHACSHG